MNLLYADVTVENCIAELWLNDIPLGRATPAISNVSVGAQMYVVDGDNSMELIVQPGFEPARARDRSTQPLPENASAHGRLVALAPGQFTDDPKAPVLLGAAWPGGAGTAPYSVHARNFLGTMFGPWAWQSAPRLQLDAATTGAVHEVLERIRVSLQQGDPAVLGSLAMPKFEAAARAFPTRSLTDTVRQFSAVVTRNAASPGWQMPPLDPTQFNFRLVAGGRLIECVNRDWRATVRSAPRGGGVPYYFPMFLGLAGGRFAVFL